MFKEFLKGWFTTYLLSRVIDYNCCLAEDFYLGLVIYPAGPVVVESGQHVSFDCTILSYDNQSLNSVRLSWHYGGLFGHLHSPDIKVRFSEAWKDNHTVTLSIRNVQAYDTGEYTCSTDRTASQTVKLIVRNIDPSYRRRCSASEFRCGTGVCISYRYQCDRKVDCSDESDELLCQYKPCDARTEFTCDSGQCINRSYVCDVFESRDCRDGSDERGCPGRFGVHPSRNDHVTTSERDHLSTSTGFVVCSTMMACVFVSVLTSVAIVFFIFVAMLILRRRCRTGGRIVGNRREPLAFNMANASSAQARSINVGASASNCYDADILSSADSTPSNTVGDYDYDDALTVNESQCVRLTSDGCEVQMTNVDSYTLVRPPSYDVVTSPCHVMSEQEQIEPSCDVQLMADGFASPRSGTPPPPYSTLDGSARHANCSSSLSQA